MQGRQESVLILPSSSTLSCSPSTHVWLNSSVCLEQKIQGKIKELLQMTLVSCMNTKTDSERQCTLRCHRFWWENAMAVVFFFTIMLQQQKYVLEVVTLYHKSTRERERRGRVNEEYTIPCSLMCCCHKPRWPLALLTTVMLWK